MGASLVVYEDQSAWEAAHDLQYEKALRRNTLHKFFVQIVICYFSLLAVSFFRIPYNLGWLSPFNEENAPWFNTLTNIILVGSIVAITVYFLPKLWSGLSHEARTLPFDCPTCHQTISLSSDWLCGHCRERHTAPKDPSVFLGCKNDRCYTNKGIPKHRAQAALQCPHCKDHIVLNPLLYKEIGSYKSELKYPGVARFLDDKEPPSLGGTPPAKLPDVGDLGAVIKAAMDRSI